MSNSQSATREDIDRVVTQFMRAAYVLETEMASNEAQWDLPLKKRKLSWGCESAAIWVQMLRGGGAKRR